MIKKLFAMLSIFLISIIMSSVAFGEIKVDFVKVNDDEVKQSGTNFILDVDRGDKLEVRVRLSSNISMEDVQIEAVLRGVDSSETVDDVTDAFDMKANVSYTKTLNLPLIQKIDQDTYRLRIRISDRDSPTFEQTYDLAIGTKRHSVEVRDVVLSPDKEVKAGRSLLATVRIRNRGERDEDGVKVVVSIPKLGVSAADFVDKLDKEGDDDDQATTEEMFLRIPEDAKTGNYDVVADAYFDDGDKKNTFKTTIFVLEEEDEDDKTSVSDKKIKGDSKEEKTIITVAADRQNAVKGGAEAAYLIALTNAGSTAKAYSIKAEGPNSLGLRLNQNILLLEPDESKAFTVFASAKQDAAAGEQSFMVTVSSDNKVLKQLPLSISVQEGQANSVSKIKRGIEIGLVVLVVLFFIIGLIIVFSKLRGEDEEEGKGGKEYY